MLALITQHITFLYWITLNDVRQRLLYKYKANFLGMNYTSNRLLLKGIDCKLKRDSSVAKDRTTQQEITFYKTGTPCSDLCVETFLENIKLIFDIPWFD